MMRRCCWLLAALLALVGGIRSDGADRLRVIIETDAGGDPDDEQSLVRFLVYANEWDVEGILANRREARDGENLNAERTGLGIVRQLLSAYGECQPRLAEHDARFPTEAQLRERTVAGYDDTEDGVRLVLEAVDRDDPRPVWFCNWGTDHGASSSCLKRALDQVLAERGAVGYARFKSRLRLSSDDQFGDHTFQIAPPFSLWVDTFRPEVDRKRWYHRFSGLTAKAGGFDIDRDVRRDHGPLGALYPTNTTHQQKEGDTMSFLYLVPTGMNDPNHPEWGSWAGRYGLQDDAEGRPYYWANAEDAWEGKRHRDQSLARFAEALQNDFRARMDWCVKPRNKANHPPTVSVEGEQQRAAAPGETITLDASNSRDTDGNALSFAWFHYGEVSGWKQPIEIVQPQAKRVEVRMPDQPESQEAHFVVAITDNGEPPLTRYGRVIVKIEQTK